MLYNLGQCLYQIQLSGKHLQRIKQDEVESEPPRLDAKNLGLLCEIVNHPTHDHIRERIGQQRRYLRKINDRTFEKHYHTYKYEYEPGSIIGERGRVLNAECAEYVAYCLSKARADDDPTVPFTIVDGLDQVCDGRKCEEDDEENIGTKVGAKRP